MANSSLFADLAGLQDQLRGMWRFRWTALIVAWSVAILGWGGVFLIPNKYRAQAKIFVNAGTTLSHATQGISFGDSINDQMQQVSAMLLGTQQLRDVANATNLMAGAITAEQQQSVINGLRESITLTADVNREDPRSKATLFTLSYTDTNRERAIRVVDRLLNDFVEGSLSGRSQGSVQAERFLSQQIGDYGRRLSSTEQQLAEFKKRNIGLVPGEQGDVFTQLQSDNSSLMKLKANLYVAERKRDELSRELRSGQQFTTGGAPSAAGGPLAGAALDTEQQIAVDQQKLDQMLLQYTDQYPDVVALKQTIKELKSRQKAQMAAAQKGDVGAASALGLTANPVFQQLEVQYDAERVEVAAIQQQISDLQRQIATLKARIGAAPQVQAEYARLTRNYQVTKQQYDALLARLDSTRLGQQAASTGLVDFKVIDPPSASFKPVSPKRALLIFAMFALAIGAGVGVAYLLHLMSPVFVSARQLGEVTGLTVLGAVSMAWAEKHRVEQHRGNIRYALWSAGLLIVTVGLLVFQGHISNMVGELLA